MIKRITLPDPRLALASAASLVLGLAASLGPHPAGQAAGSVLILLGGAGLTWWFWRAWQVWQYQQAVRAAAARRAVLQAARRERAEKQRTRRQTQRATRARAAARQAEERAARRQAEHLEAVLQAEQRAARERRLETEVAHLQSLTEAQLAAEVESIFARRGFRAESMEREAAGDFTLTAKRDGGRQVARCVPTGRVAGLVDVQALEAWRQAANAEHAYLIALAGFSPAAVRSARGLPLTLVEAHLLAHWQVHGRSIHSGD